MSIGLLTAVVLIALVFTYINGFHDTANSIATVVATKVLTPGQAVLLAAVTNLFGAMVGTAVARTIASGLIDSGVLQVGGELLVCALLGAIVWNLITWWRGLPSSSSHALIGGLCGAAFAASHGNFHAIIWATDPLHWWRGGGVVPKVIVPMIASPIAGFVLGLVVMGLLLATFAWFGNRTGFLRRFGRTPFVNLFFGKAQIAVGHRDGRVARHERRAEVDGHHRAGAGRRDRRAQLRPPAGVAAFPARRRTPAGISRSRCG